MKYLIKMALAASISLLFFSACEKDPAQGTSGTGTNQVPSGADTTQVPPVTDPSTIRNTTWTGTLSQTEVDEEGEHKVIMSVTASFSENDGVLTMQLTQMLLNDQDITSMLRSMSPESFEPIQTPFTYTYENGEGTILITETDDETGETLTVSARLTVNGNTMTLSQDDVTIILNKQ